MKENDLPSLFGTIGLPLKRNVARARIEIRPAISGTRFLPLAVPNNLIKKVQVRYYNECTGTPTLIPGSTFDLKPLPAADQAAFVSAGGGVLWGLESTTTAGVGDSSRFFPLTLPTYGGCGQPYLPVGVEVRLASTDTVDLNQSCAALITAKFADCFHRLSQIRVWNDGVAPRIRDVTLTGGCGIGDAYFGPLPTAATNCRFGANVDVFWGTMDVDEPRRLVELHGPGERRGCVPTWCEPAERRLDRPQQRAHRQRRCEQRDGGDRLDGHDDRPRLGAGAR